MGENIKYKPQVLLLKLVDLPYTSINVIKKNIIETKNLIIKTIYHSLKI